MRKLSDRITDQEPLVGSIEQLEARLLLDGKLRIAVNSSGDISIRGDGRSNYLEIAAETTDQNGDGDTNDLVIRGLPDTSGAPTVIRDGRDTMDQFVIDEAATIDGRLRISLGGGDDFVTFRGVEVNGQFQLRTGGGSDSFGFFDGSEINDSAKFRTGGGNDYLNIKNASFNGTFDLRSGGGVDYVGLSNFSSQAGAFSSFNMGGAADVIYIEDSIVRGDIEALMGGLIDTIYVADGTDLRGNVYVDMGNLFDLLVLENDISLDQANLVVDGGRGGFGYENLLFLNEDSPYLNNVPGWIVGFEVDFYTISGNSTTGNDLSTTLSRWIMDLYYSSQPDVNIDVIDTVLAANIARGFDYNDLPRSDQGPAPDVADVKMELESFLADSSFYRYQTFFVKGVFEGEISDFNWDRF